MPRRRPDQVIEHRVSLSDYERGKINEALQTAQANVALDTVTGAAMAVGTALGGAGALLAAGVLMYWKAPEILSDITDKTNTFIDNLVDGILPGTPIELRREAQALAARRGDVARNIDAFCTLSSSKYDQAKCSQAQQAKNQYFDDLAIFQMKVRASASPSIQKAIYYGLGDINPEFIAP